MTNSFGLIDPALYRFHADAIEVRSRSASATRPGSWSRNWSNSPRGSSAMATRMAARSRGLLASSLGDSDAASAALEEALGLCDRLGEPFERARTLLLLGSVQRRDRKKRPARESLEAALAIFERLGARPWSERTRDELARIGGRAATAELTPTEERVAELLASGLTYQQAADALFVSPKTVQWNVSKIYRKLGITSRGELVKHSRTTDRLRSRPDLRR